MRCRSHPVVEILALAFVCVLLACTRAQPQFDTKRHPLIVLGIDGAEWSVIHKLWKNGELPNLKRLAEEGTSAVLETDYGISPVIWTTMATGRKPEDHGITDFTVNTADGMVPVSSTVRKVPALWNMASRAGLNATVVGWWASWPAEEINGVVVSDRAHLQLERIVFPQTMEQTFSGEREKAKKEYPGFADGRSADDRWMQDGAFRDRIISHEARRLARAPFDVLFAYWRCVDIASHRYWTYYEPENYSDVRTAQVQEKADIIPTVYRTVDQAVGDVLAAAPEDSNVIVVSDHGFFAGAEQHFVYLSMSRLLEILGFLVRDGDRVLFAQTTVFPVDSPPHAQIKKLRLSMAGRDPNGRVPPEAATQELERISKALATVTYQDGGPVFDLQRVDLPPGVDLIAKVRVDRPSLQIQIGKQLHEHVVEYINRISGTHDKNTHGVFIAKGPDVTAGAEVTGISVNDIAPTVLFALGLPVAEDFVGRAQTGLFTEHFRAHHALRTIPTWGTTASWGTTESAADSRLVDELRALGYMGEQ